MATVRDFGKVRPCQKFMDSFYGMADISPGSLRASVFIAVEELAKNSTENYDYSLSRLIEGMKSSRLAVRLGYANAFTEIVRLCSMANGDEVFGKIEELLPLSVTKEEPLTGRLIGHCLCLMSLVKSGKCSITLLENIADKLVNLSKQYTYLGTFLTKFIVFWINSMNEDDFKKLLWPLLQTELKISPETTADQLWVFLEVGNRFPKLLEASGVEIPDLCTKNTLLDIARIVKTFSQPVHPVWFVLLKKFLSANTETFGYFWKTVVTSLFTSEERPLLVVSAFRLTDQTLTLNLDAEKVMVIGDELLFSSMARAVSDKAKMKFSKPLCKNILDKLCKIVSDKDFWHGHTIDKLLRRLLDVEPTFDRITAGRLVETLVTLLPEQDSIIYLDYIEGKFAEEGVSAVEVICYLKHMQQMFIAQKGRKHNIRKRILELLVFWRLSSLSNLTLSGVSARKFCQLPCGSEKKVTDTCNSVLHTCLESLCFIIFQPRLKKIDIPKENVELLLDLIHCLRNRLPELNAQLVNQCISVIEKLIAEADSGTSFGFVSLMLYCILWLYISGRQKYYADILEEVLSCYKHFEEENMGVTQKSDHSWIDVIVDLILSLCSEASYKHIKPVVHVALHYFASSMKPVNISPIIKVLRPEETEWVGKNEEDLEDEEHPNGQDVEDSETSDTSDENEEEEEIMPGEDFDVELENSVRRALGDAAACGSDEDSAVSDFSDDTMLRLDEGLSAAFRSSVHKSRDAKKGRQREQQEQKKAFRLRCLDLLLIFLHSSPSGDTELTLLEDLLTLMNEYSRVEDHNVLLEKTRSLILIICSTKPSGLKLDQKGQLLERLERIFVFSEKVSVPAVQLAIGESVKFLVRLCEGDLVNETCAKSVKEKFVDRLRFFMEKRTCSIPEAAFTVTFEKYPEGCMQCLPVLASCAFSEDGSVRIFRKTQACTWCLNFCSKRTVSRNIDDRESSKKWKKTLKAVRKGVVKVLQNAIAASSQGETSANSTNPRYLAAVILLLKNVVDLNDSLDVHKLKDDRLLSECLQALTEAKLWKKKPFSQAAGKLVSVFRKSPHSLMLSITKELADLSTENDQPPKKKKRT